MGVVATPTLFKWSSGLPLRSQCSESSLLYIYELLFLQTDWFIRRSRWYKVCFYPVFILGVSSCTAILIRIVSVWPQLMVWWFVGHLLRAVLFTCLIHSSAVVYLVLQKPLSKSNRLTKHQVSTIKRLPDHMIIM